MRRHLDHIYLPALNLYIIPHVLLRGLHLKKSENRSLHAIDILQGSMSRMHDTPISFIVQSAV